MEQFYWRCWLLLKAQARPRLRKQMTTIELNQAGLEGPIVTPHSRRIPEKKDEDEQEPNVL